MCIYMYLYHIAFESHLLFERLSSYRAYFLHKIMHIKCDLIYALDNKNRSHIHEIYEVIVCGLILMMCSMAVHSM